MDKENSIHSTSRAGPRACAFGKEVRGEFPRNVLVVDDHDDARRLFVIMLSAQGWGCAEASDGREAIRMAAARAFDLILMDLRMPLMSGFEAIERLREQGERVKIIAITADAFESARAEAMKAGADAYLTKPVTRESLITLCDGLLRANEREKEDRSSRVPISRP